MTGRRAFAGGWRRVAPLLGIVIFGAGGAAPVGSQLASSAVTSTSGPVAAATAQDQPAATAAAAAPDGAPAATGPAPAAGRPSPPRWQPEPDDHWQGHGTDPTNPAACDPIDPAQCMLPYPNNWLTKPDPTSGTGRRLDFVALGMPRNAAGKPIEPQEWNRSDGFSAGTQILTLVPGMTENKDLVPSGLPPVTDLGMNQKPNLGVVLLDTQTGRHWPVWVEVDQYTQESGVLPAVMVQQDLMIHPAVNLTDGHHYIVALRHLVTDSGAIAQPSAAFKAYRDGTAPASDPRTAHMNNLFTTLQRAGVSRADLYLAWDFTTASTQNVTGRLLHIRDDAFAQLAGKAPAFTVDTVTDFTPSQNSKVARRIEGHFTVPCYIAPTCDPPAKCDTATGGFFDDCPTPGQFLLDPTNPDALPSQVAGQTDQANFICNAGRTAFENGQKMRPVEYGHGLFGGAGEVNSDPQESMANRFGMMYCATDWFGWATSDIPNAAISDADLSRFTFLADRGQQGELNFLFLARLMVHPQGFGSNPAFQFASGASFIDTTQAYYDGNSQGGIFGGTVCAVSIDVHRCVLGVPGMDYSVLLPRSSDYVAQQPVAGSAQALANGDIAYSYAFDVGYPDQTQRMLILDLLQTLWDRADPNGYASHMTGGLPNTPSHHVLMQMAYGDHQVANITAETEARTIGAAGLYPPLVSARYGPYKDPFWGIPAITSFPYNGSAITMFDTGPVKNVSPIPKVTLNWCGITYSFNNDGTDPPPTIDQPNRSGEDPHEAPRRTQCGQVQKSNFLSPGGMVTNPQPGGAPYFAWNWDGKTGL